MKNIFVFKSLRNLNRRIATLATLLLICLFLGCATTIPNHVENSHSGFIGPKDRSNVIVFIHGVMGSSTSTWLNTKTGAYFPEMLQTDKDFRDNYSIYVLEYHSPRFTTAATINEIATRELQRLKDDGVLSGERRVFFVTHSMGGLIAKRMLVEMNRPNPEELEHLDRVKCVIFLSTPALGAPIADYVSFVTLNPQLSDLRPADFNTFLQALEDDWQNLLRDRDRFQLPNPQSLCAYETLPTMGVKVVSRIYASTRCDSSPVGMNLNHLEIASPPTVHHEPYIWVKNRIFESSRMQDVSRSTMFREAKNTTVTGVLPDMDKYDTSVISATYRVIASKESIGDFDSHLMPRLTAGELISMLTFDSRPDRRGAYNKLLIKLYIVTLAKFSSFRYVVFLDKGIFVGLMPIAQFASQFERFGDTMTNWINEGNFTALRDIGMNEEKIQSTATALEALDRLEKTGSAALGVINRDGGLVGVANATGILYELREKAAVSKLN